MKVIVAGSRNITNLSLLTKVMSKIINEYKIQVDEVVSGGAKGVDTLGEKWAEANGISIQSFPARWDDLSIKDAMIRKNKFGRLYNVLAGFQRNEKMAEYADVLIAFWNGYSNGTADMVQRAKKHNLKVFVFTTKDNLLSLWENGKISDKFFTIV